MANGQPQSSVLRCSLCRGGRPCRPRDLALQRRWRRRDGHAFQRTNSARSPARRENPDSSGITTVKEYNFVPSAKLPEVKGMSDYKPMNDRTVRFAINVWAGWGPIIYANNGFKPGKVWKTPGGKDFKVELVLIDDPVAMRDAFAAGNMHIGWATLDMVPLFLEGLRKDSARHAAHLPAGRLVERRRRHRRARDDQDDGRPARQERGAGAELAVALLPAQRADQRRRAAGRGAVQVHPGRVPGRGRVQRRQAAWRASSAGRRTSTTSRRSAATGCWSRRRPPTS